MKWGLRGRALEPDDCLAVLALFPPGLGEAGIFPGVTVTGYQEPEGCASRVWLHTVVWWLAARHQGARRAMSSLLVPGEEPAWLSGLLVLAGYSWHTLAYMRGF